MVEQKEIILPPHRRGFHIITNHVISELDDLPSEGMLHLFIKHTSAAIAINENADPSVTDDFENFISHLIPDGDKLFTHILEGSDDMSAHIKSSMIGQSVSVPITNHKLNLGTWQGIYLCEFRDYGGNRKILATILS